MSRRNLVLTEMGYHPQWQLRHGQAAPHPALDDDAIAIPSTTDTPAPALPIATETAPPPVTIPAAAAPAAAEVAIRDWADLQQQIADCQRCQLSTTRSHTVTGRGNPQAKLLIIGEAPGEQEDKQGLPFVGKAGQLLENMLAAAGIDSERDAYICNLLKCRPPGNRNPSPDEIANCQRYLQWQIDSIQPRLIVAVGRFAAQALLDSQAPLGSLRGKLHHYRQYPVLVSFHPAYLLRSPTEKARAWQDWCLVKRQLS